MFGVYVLRPLLQKIRLKISFDHSVDELTTFLECNLRNQPGQSLVLVRQRQLEMIIFWYYFIFIDIIIFWYYVMFIE